jgi:hypothetical protein
MLMRMPDIDEIADELYGLPPEEFTAARTQYEKDAKAAGNRDEAARIHALAKPNVTAWLANQLTREHRDELARLMELGAGLRNATRNLAGDQLRELSRQQQKLVFALVEQARQLARAAGRTVSQDTARGLDDTLRAALADGQAADLLLAGRLTDALHSSGFGSVFGDTAEVANVIPQDVIDAQRALADATAGLEDAQRRAADADQAAAAAQERLSELRQQLEEASSAASDADRRRRDQATALQQAERAARDAERKNQDAKGRRNL